MVPKISSTSHSLTPLTKKKTEGSWTRGRIIFFLQFIFRMAVLKLKYLGYYGGQGGLGLGLGLELGIHKFTEGYLYFRKYRYVGCGDSEMDNPRTT